MTDGYVLRNLSIDELKCLRAAVTLELAEREGTEDKRCVTCGRYPFTWPRYSWVPASKIQQGEH